MGHSTETPCVDNDTLRTGECAAAESKAGWEKAVEEAVEYVNMDSNIAHGS